MKCLFITLTLLTGTAFAWWQIETVDSAGDMGLFNSLALDSSGNPHISYFDYTKGVLKYALLNASSWEIETVDSTEFGQVGLYNSLALDSSGNPHVSYSYFWFSDLKYAFWNGSSWEIETVDSEGVVGTHTSLALDSS